MLNDLGTEGTLMDPIKSQVYYTHIGDLITMSEL